MAIQGLVGSEEAADAYALQTTFVAMDIVALTRVRERFAASKHFMPFLMRWQTDANSMPEKVSLSLCSCKARSLDFASSSLDCPRTYESSLQTRQ